MSNKTITKEMREDLRKPLPAEAVTKHPTKTYLSSIKAIYVVERLNDVFGLGSWRSKVEKQSVSDKGMVVVKLIFEIPEYGIYHESYGGNDNGGENSKNFDLGDAYKGAATDALTKICSFLEIGLDVFKGKHDNKTGTPSFPKEDAPDLKWLNRMTGKVLSRDWNRSLATLKDGKDVTYLRTKFKISKENEQLLIIESKKK